jgi:Family of unknown function (DUF6298)/Putative collagen-binding domain of a collagenase
MRRLRQGIRLTKRYWIINMADRSDLSVGRLISWFNNLFPGQKFFRFCAAVLYLVVTTWNKNPLAGSERRMMSLRYSVAVLGFSALLTFLPAAVAQGAEGAPDNPVHIDFSFAGYKAGAQLPLVKAVLSVRPGGGDDTLLLQGALDRIASMPVGADGFRGALLLAPGRYRVGGQLHINTSGVVLRGAGQTRTTIVAEGTSRRTLIEIGAAKDVSLNQPRAVTVNAPAGGDTLTLDSVDGLAAGDHVVVRRPSTQEWISAMSMSGLPGTFANQRLDWHPGSHDLVWDRAVVSVDGVGHRVTLDAPITTALENEYGGGTLARVSGEAVPSNIGVENLTLESSFDATRPKDEDHAWIAIALDHVEDAWVRGVTARHFADSAVRVNWRGRRITVEDCRSEAPVSEAGGYRRQAFLVDGQQVLVHRCWSEAGMNDFASGLLAGGPNVFLDCDAQGSLGASGAFEGWASGVLYERVHVPASSLQLVLDFSRAQGGGWTAANSVLWNSTAQTVDAIGPPGAPNFVVNSTVSLYEAELKARTGHGLAVATVMHGEGTAKIPDFHASDVRPVESSPAPLHRVEIVNGRFVADGHAMWGLSQTEAWWRGDTSPYTAAQSTGSSVSRFMPGVVAPGETEDLDEMAERLKARDLVSFQVNPGLWYEHRRDSHTVERRDDGNVWAPFYEMPWARSGKGVAWDGLSRFDLTRYNPWYFERHREFARRAAEKGFLVFYDLYNTHNVLEIGPHWIDYAWRPANNVNDTGLPEPPPFKPHNRNDVGNEFYSTNYAPLRELHRAYMMHTFDEMADQPNVLFGLAYQYAGPLEFEQFFQDVAREWEAKHPGKHIRIVLTTGKQTTDAILADPVRSKQIAVVDMRYWEYRPDGSLFAPKAGENHAFRELISKEFLGYTDTPPATTPEQMYRETREYRDKYPDIALMPMENGAGPLPILMGGAASQSALVGGRPPAPVPTATERATAMYPRTPQRTGAPAAARENPDRVIEEFIRKYLADDLMKMSPKDGWTTAPERTWTLAGGSAEPVLIYSLSGGDVTIAHDLPASRYQATWFDPRDGSTRPQQEVSARQNTVLHKPDEQPWLLLLKPE